MADLINPRDLAFLLHDWLKVEALTAYPRFAEHDRETFTAVLETARQLAVRLQAHAEVNVVGYPGLSGRDHAVVDRQMAGPGTMITIRLDGGAQRADQFITHLRIAVPAVSLGAVDTLVQRPASLTHQAMGEEERGRLGIPEDLIRISVGAEHLEDLWEDLRSSLEATACSGVTRS